MSFQFILYVDLLDADGKMLPRDMVNGSWFGRGSTEAKSIPDILGEGLLKTAFPIRFVPHNGGEEVDAILQTTAYATMVVARRTPERVPFDELCLVDLDAIDEDEFVNDDEVKFV